MGRPREFDPEAALAGAMQLFWARGYEAASLEDLLEAMGIARGSLYKAFRSKRRVFLLALELYDRTVIEHCVQTLRDPAGGDGAARIRRLLDEVARAVAESGDRRGCFLCNAAVDRAPADPEVADRVTAMLRRLEAATAAALGETGAWRDRALNEREQAARAVIGAYMGLRVLARAGYPAAELGSLADTYATRFAGEASVS